MPAYTTSDGRVCPYQSKITIMQVSMLFGKQSGQTRGEERACSDWRSSTWERNILYVRDLFASSRRWPSLGSKAPRTLGCDSASVAHMLLRWRRDKLTMCKIRCPDQAALSDAHTASLPIASTGQGQGQGQGPMEICEASINTNTVAGLDSSSS
jgi:hypothetical protein